MLVELPGASNKQFVQIIYDVIKYLVLASTWFPHDSLIFIVEKSLLAAIEHSFSIYLQLLEQ
jgi:hypothetical protein